MRPMRQPLRYTMVSKNSYFKFTKNYFRDFQYQKSQQVMKSLINPQALYLLNKADFKISLIKQKIILQWVVSIHRPLDYETNAITTSLHCKTNYYRSWMIVSQNSLLYKNHNQEISFYIQSHYPVFQLSIFNEKKQFEWNKQQKIQIQNKQKYDIINKKKNIAESGFDPPTFEL
ncbi:hypothetical protein pb186bvf_017352 [Paramecium bursaria]